MKAPFRKPCTLFVILCGMLVSLAAQAAEKNSFKMIWSTYVGFMPWDYATRNGIVAKWADKYGITIHVIRVGNYSKSLDEFAAGRADACPMTNIDMLTAPAAKGLDATALIIGSFSNGNDGIVLKGAGKPLTAIKGLPVRMIAFSVSHYLLARGLDSVGLTERDIQIIDTPESDIFRAFMTDAPAVVTWKPLLSQFALMPNTSLVFDSSHIPGEIIDVMGVNTEVLKANPKFGRALVGAWYETLAILFGKDAKAAAALAALAQASGADLPGFKSQLATTKMFILPAGARGFMSGANLVRTMDLVRSFSFTHNLLGKKAKNVDAIGIEFPHGRTLGDPNNIKMRFNASYTQLAAEGKL
jgi:NitT/TauT family transport system substrate-binding protein